MNRDCNGDYFEAAGRRWYRCLGGGSIVPAPTNLDECPACERKVVSANDYGAAQTRSRIQVKPPTWDDWFDLPVEQEVVAYEVTTASHRETSGTSQPPASSGAGASAVGAGDQSYPGYGSSLADARFLVWLAERLVYVYHELPGIDFVLALRRIAGEIAKTAGDPLLLARLKLLGGTADPLATFTAAHSALSAHAQPLDSLRDRDTGDETDGVPVDLSRLDVSCETAGKWHPVSVQVRVNEIERARATAPPVCPDCGLPTEAFPGRDVCLVANAKEQAGRDELARQLILPAADDDAHPAEVHPGHVAEREGVDAHGETVPLQPGTAEYDAAVLRDGLEGRR